MFLALSHSAAAFQPAMRPASAVQQHRTTTTQMLFFPEPVETATRYALVLPTMYALMSLNEYATHRYFQHLEFNKKGELQYIKDAWMAVTDTTEEPNLSGDGHVEHHAETFDDMSLKNDERWRQTP